MDKNESRFKNIISREILKEMNVHNCQACPQCHENFSYKATSKKQHGHLPLLLLCGHAFCEKCLLKDAKKGIKFIECPQCKEKTDLEGDEASIESLCPDIYRVGSIVLNRKHGPSLDFMLLKGGMLFEKKEKPGTAQQGASSQTTPCGECSLRPATCLCLKCDASMCALCFDKVHQSKTLRKHVALPLGEGINELSAPAACSVHAQPIEYYCEDDGERICAKCVILGAHKRHAISALDEKDKEALENMAPLIADAKKVLGAIKKSNKTMSENLASVQQRFCHVTQHIRDHFTHLHAKLQAREIQLLKSITEIKQASLAKPEEMKSKLLDEAKKIEYALSGAEKLEQGSTEFSAQTILTRLTSAQSLACCVVPLESAEEPVRFEVKGNSGEDLLASIKQYGQVEGMVSEGFQMCSLKESPEDFFDDVDMSISGRTTPCVTPDSASVMSLGEGADSDALSVVSGDTASVSSSAIVTGRKNLKRVRPHVSRKELVYVSHIRNPCHFCVQQVADTDKVKRLRQLIQKNAPTFRQSAPPTVLEIGDLVLGQFAIDNHWYRAKVTEVYKGPLNDLLEADLYYLDYGNEERVPIKRIRSMQERFLRYPELAITCTLIDIVPATQTEEWDGKAIESFARMTQDKPMLMTTRGFDNNIHQVDLSKPPNDNIEDDRPVSVRDALVFLEYAIFSSPLSDVTTGALEAARYMRKYYSPQLPSKGEYLDVAISHANSPGDFSVQLVREGSSLEKLMSQLQAFYCKAKDDQYAIYVPQRGMVCVAQYSEDQAWYRALITDLPGRRQVHVKYVDFGNDEILPHFKLKKILDKFIILPIQAIQCKLADVQPMEEHRGWSEQASQLFASYCVGKTLELSVRRVNEALHSAPVPGMDSAPAPSLEVILRDPTTDPQALSLNLLLVQNRFAVTPVQWSTSSSERVAAEAKPISLSAMPREQLAQAPIRKVPLDAKAAATPVTVPAAAKLVSRSAPVAREPGKPHLVEVIVSHLEHPGHLYIQLAEAGAEGLDQLMMTLNRDMHTSSAQPEVTSFSVGDMVAARYSRDQLWYRARVAHVHGEMYQVHMIDFGFKDMLTLDNLRRIDPKFLKAAMHSTRCHLVGIQPAGDVRKWSQTATEYLASRVAKRKLFIVSNTNERQEDSLPIDLLLEERIVGDALSPDQKNYISLAEQLMEKGLALPFRKSTTASNELPAHTQSVQDAQPPEEPNAKPFGDRYESVQNESTLHKKVDSFTTSVPGLEPLDLSLSPLKPVRASNGHSHLSDSPDHSQNTCEKNQHEDVIKGNNSLGISQGSSPQGSAIHSPNSLSPDRSIQSANVPQQSYITPEASPTRLHTQNESQDIENVSRDISRQSRDFSLASRDTHIVPREVITETMKQRSQIPAIDSTLNPLDALPTEELLDYPPADELPNGSDVQIVPTYVGFDGCVYAQIVYPDESSKGRYSFALKENSVEIALQDRLLERLGLCRVRTIRDGNCLFRCIVASKALDGEELHHSGVRAATYDYMHQHWALFKDWLGSGDAESHTSHMRSDGVYAGELEIRALCYLYDVQIQVFLGGLAYPITCKTFGCAGRPVIRLCYQCDGQYDRGHYDLVLRSDEMDDEAVRDVCEAGYTEWRRDRLEELKSQPVNAQTYDDSLVGQIMTYLQKTYLGSSALGAVFLSPGDPCVAMYSDDGRYYRAQVEAILPEGIKVNYVDFGNTETVPPDNLRRACFVSLPRQCVKLALDHVQPRKGDTWYIPALTHMHNLLIDSEQSHIARVKSTVKGYTVADIITPKGINFANHLVHEGWAVYAPDRTAIAHVKTTANIPPVSSSPVPAHNNMDHPTKPPTSQMQGPYHDPAKRHRAVQRTTGQDSSQDTSRGSSQSPSSLTPTASPLRPQAAPKRRTEQSTAARLAHNLLGLGGAAEPPSGGDSGSSVSGDSTPVNHSPARPGSSNTIGSGDSLEAAILTSSPGRTWGEQAEEADREPLNLMTSPQRQSMVTSSQAESKMTSPQRQNTSPQTQGMTSPQAQIGPPTRVPVRQVASPYRLLQVPGVGEMMALHVTYVTSAQQIHVQYLQQQGGEANPDIARVNRDLETLLEIDHTLNTEFEHYPPLTLVKPGMACCACASLDGSWYRAEVLELSAPYIGVLFCDYGNAEFLPSDSVRAMPADLTTLPAQCAEARMHGIRAPPGGFPPQLEQAVCALLSEQKFIGFVRSEAPDVSLDLIDVEDYAAMLNAKAAGLPLPPLTPVAKHLFPKQYYVTPDEFGSDDALVTGVTEDSRGSDEYVGSDSDESAIIEEEEDLPTDEQLKIMSQNQSCDQNISSQFPDPQFKFSENDYKPCVVKEAEDTQAVATQDESVRNIREGSTESALSEEID